MSLHSKQATLYNTAIVGTYLTLEGFDFSESNFLRSSTMLDTGERLRLEIKLCVCVRAIHIQDVFINTP